MYQGDWVSDTAVCGEFREPMLDELSFFASSSSSSDKEIKEEKEPRASPVKLPELGLADPASVIISARRDALRLG